MKLKKWLAVLFPVFLFFICEMGHMQSFSRFRDFLAHSFGVALFDIILLAAFFGILVLITKRVYIAAIIEGTIFFAISVVEYYKFNISGTHFTVPDLAMTTNIGDITQFANLSFNWVLLCCFLLLALYIFLLFYSKARLDIATKKGVPLFCAGLFALCTIIIVPTVFQPVSACFGIENDRDSRSSSGSEYFDDNQLIASFILSANEQVKNIVKKPKAYGKEAINQLMQDDGVPSFGSKTPNVVFIMSESFADLRQLGTADIPEDAYSVYDRLKEQGASIPVSVPTFGGQTVRTEFELLFGLPVKALNNAPVPHKLLNKDTNYETFAKLYQEKGYHTTYIHPFSSTFYGRDEYYKNYGFEQLLFEEDFPEGTERFRSYISDAAALQQVKNTMQKTAGPDYIYLTTMQNHQPYSEAGRPETEVYLEGIRESQQALMDFVQWMRSQPEETVVVFVGDHFPCFTKDNQTYNQQVLEDAVYHQTALVFSNIGISLERSTEVSAFYLPHMVYSALFGADTPYVNTMLSFMQQYPVYGVSLNSAHQSIELDMLTYDRTVGKQYSVLP